MSQNEEQQQNNGNGNSNPYTLQLTIASDYYSARLSIELNSPNAVVTQEAILEFLKKRNVVYGVIPAALNAAASNPSQVTNLVIAKGKPHENGVDGYIDYTIDINHKAKPKMNDDGTVDFKEMDTFQTVMEGDLLGTKVLPTTGEDGITVTGKQVRAKPGKTVNFKLGKYVQLSEDGMQMFAQATGTIEIVGDRIGIIKVLEIRTDVGVKTGNIRFNGKVVVFGNVITGYSIECDDDLEIRGLVEAATIDCGGNITIGAGIQGNDEAKVSCKGDLISRFINNAEVRVNGNIKSDAIMHATVFCNGQVEVQGRKGLIIGGELNVRGNINAKAIGSEIGTITKIRLGVDSTILDRYKEITEKIKELKENIKKLDQALTLLDRQLKADPANQKARAMFDKSASSKRQYHDEMMVNAKELQQLQDLISQLQDSSIQALDVYPGTKIRIGHSHYNVKKLIKGAQICKQDGEIVTVRT